MTTRRTRLRSHPLVIIGSTSIALLGAFLLGADLSALLLCYVAENAALAFLDRLRILKCEGVVTDRDIHQLARMGTGDQAAPSLPLMRQYLGSPLPREARRKIALEGAVTTLPMTAWATLMAAGFFYFGALDPPSSGPVTWVLLVAGTVGQQVLDFLAWSRSDEPSRATPMSLPVAGIGRGQALLLILMVAAFAQEIAPDKAITIGMLALILTKGPIEYLLVHGARRKTIDEIDWEMRQPGWYRRETTTMRYWTGQRWWGKARTVEVDAQYALPGWYRVVIDGVDTRSYWDGMAWVSDRWPPKGHVALLDRFDDPVGPARHLPPPDPVTTPER